MMAALVSGGAWAQENATATADGSTGEATGAASPLEIRRGLHVTGDFGVYFGLGGRNTSVAEGGDSGQPLPTKGAANAQPAFGVTVGYDVLSGDAMNLALGARVGMAYNAGTARVTAANSVAWPQKLTYPADYAIGQFGAAVAASFFISDRSALTFKVDGGLARLAPDPAVPYDAEGAGKAVFSGYVAPGLGWELYTLLNDFSVGLDVRTLLVFHDGLAPGLSITVPVRYTF